VKGKAKSEDKITIKDDSGSHSESPTKKRKTTAKRTPAKKLKQEKAIKKEAKNGTDTEEELLTQPKIKREAKARAAAKARRAEADAGSVLSSIPHGLLSLHDIPQYPHPPSPLPATASSTTTPTPTPVTVLDDGAAVTYGLNPDATTVEFVTVDDDDEEIIVNHYDNDSKDRDCIVVCEPNRFTLRPASPSTIAYGLSVVASKSSRLFLLSFLFSLFFWHPLTSFTNWIVMLTLLCLTK